MGFATNKLLACIALAIIIAVGAKVQAEEDLDVLHLKSGEKIKGTVVNRLPNGSVQFRFDKNTVPYPPNNIEKVDVGERPQLKQAQAAAETGDYEKVISMLTPVVDKFIGFQSPWIGQAAGELANALAQTGQTFKSVELGKRITELYPGSVTSQLGPILEAKTLVSQNKLDEALAKLVGVKEKLPVKSSPSPSEMQILGDYHFAMAQTMEKKGEAQQALEHYLTVVALYPSPRKRAMYAQQAADALTTQDPKLAIP